jgi:hypothetical protein
LQVNDQQRRNLAIKILPWFLIRRLLFSLIVVYCPSDSPFFQLAGNYLLSLFDIIYTVEYQRSVNKLGSFLGTVNDLFVLLLSGILFVFSDYTSNPEVKTIYGKVSNGLVFALFATNILPILGLNVKKNVLAGRRRYA